MVFSLHWNPEEVASNTSEGMPQQLDGWICQWEWRQAGKKQGLSSSLSFYIHCLQKVWPIFRVDILIQVKWSRFKVGLSILNDPIKNDSSWVWNLEPQMDWVLVIPYVVKFMTKNSHHWGVLGEWRKKWNRSWLDGSTSKVLAPHARGPDFNSQEPIWNARYGGICLKYQD